MSDTNDALNLRIMFDHGLGDCCQFATLCQLYKRRGYEVSVHYDPNKAAVFELARLPYCEGLTSKYHKWLYQPGFNAPNLLDHSGNKCALNINAEPMPKMNTEDDLWQEVKDVRLRPQQGSTDLWATRQAIKDKAKTWLQDLPRPIILTHCQGTNWAGDKNLPHYTQLELYKILLDEGCSVIECDWDKRCAPFSNANFRTIHRDFGHIDLWHLLAIVEEADALMGIDSGVFHFGSQFTDTPCLYVGYHFYPSCVCLPKPTAAMMTRNAPSYQPINISRRKEWNILHYQPDPAEQKHYKPAAKDIARNLLRMARGPRYLANPLQIGKDVMLQAMARDWQREAVGAPGYCNRHIMFDYLLRELPTSNPTIIETGCTRSNEDWSAGNSSLLFATYVDATSGNLWSVDSAKESINACLCTTIELDGCHTEQMDSVEYLKRYEALRDGLRAGGKPDLIYLDSQDTYVAGYEDHCLHEAEAAVLLRPGMIAIDDTSFASSWVGKGAKAIPYLQSQGYKIVASGYGVVLRLAPPR